MKKQEVFYDKTGSVLWKTSASWSKNPKRLRLSRLHRACRPADSRRGSGRPEGHSRLNKDVGRNLEKKTQSSKLTHIYIYIIISGTLFGQKEKVDLLVGKTHQKNTVSKGFLAKSWRINLPNDIDQTTYLRKSFCSASKPKTFLETTRRFGAWNFWEFGPRRHWRGSDPPAFCFSNDKAKELRMAQKKSGNKKKHGEIEELVNGIWW